MACLSQSAGELKFPVVLFGDFMRIFEANQLILAIKVALRQGSLVSSLTPQHDRRSVIRGVRPHVQKLLECCIGADLRMSAIAVKRLILLFDGPHLSEDLVSESLEEALSRAVQTIADECSLRLYFSFDPSEAETYLNPMKDWEPIIARFPKMRNNVIESSKCMALERYGAAVFHILLVAEYGVIEVATLMDMQGDKPGWGSLKRLNGILLNPYPQRSPFEQQHSKLLESVVPLTTVIKDNWRHKLDHADNQIVWMETDFSAQVAEEIIAATRGFMRKLSEGLP